MRPAEDNIAFVGAGKFPESPFYGLPREEVSEIYVFILQSS